MVDNKIQTSLLRLLTLVAFCFALKVSSIPLNIMRSRTFVVITCCITLNDPLIL